MSWHLFVWACQHEEVGPEIWREDMFAARPWKTVKYEEVYLHTYETVSAAQQGMER